MIQNILRHLGGIEQYGIVSLCLFALVFAAVFVWACLQRKSHLERMARIPLEADPQSAPKGDRFHE
jgi:hypothetical protein